MKVLIVPDTVEWKRSRYHLLKMLNPNEAILFPAHWPINKKGFTKISYTHDGREYTLVKKKLIP